MFALPPAIVRLRRHVVPLTFYGGSNADVLMHLGSSRDHSTIDSKALPAVIRLVRARGYRFVTLAGIRAPR